MLKSSLMLGKFDFTIAMNPLINQRYQLRQQLGRGGMGAVYRAFDRLTQTEVALKRVAVSPDRLAFNSRTEATDHHVALAREFQTLAGLRHPHIISVLDYGFDAERQPFFTMTLIEAAQTFTAASQNLSTVDKIRRLIQMLQALDYLHRHGLVHRDLKPSNVLIDRDGQVRVLDFGLAVIAAHEEGIAGTPGYMAPEVLQGHMSSVAADLYAVGVMAYEIFAQRHPFASADGSVLIHEVMLGQPDLARIPELRGGHGQPLQVIIDVLLAKTPEIRYISAAEVIADLAACAGLPLPEERGALRESYLQAAPFTGRERELATLSAALDTMLGGRNVAYLVGGESGVGKSRLIDELRIRAMVAGVTVVRGQGVEGGGLPYQLWRDVLPPLILSTELDDLAAGVLKPVTPNIGELLGRPIPDAPELVGAAGQLRLALNIVAVLRRQTAPVLLLLEDLHWAGESLGPLQQLLTVYDQLGSVMIVGTYRHDEHPNLPSDLPEMTLLSLDRLAAQQVGELTAAILGEIARQPVLVGWLTQQTEGNVFFLIEVVRALAEEAGRLANIATMTLPETVLAGGVQQIVRRRLSRVPAWGQAPLKIAAVVGRQIDEVLMAQIFDTSAPAPSAGRELADWLAVCTDATVLEIRDGRWRFTHDKLREAVVFDLTDAEVKTLNRTVAETIEAVYPDTAAYHEALLEYWHRADDLDKEITYLTVVAERLVELQSAYDHARRLLERGLGRLADDDPRAVALLNYLAASWENQGNYDTARPFAERAHDLATQLGDQHGLAMSLLKLGATLTEQGRQDDAQAHYLESLALGQALDDQRVIAWSLYNLGMTATRRGQYTDARDYLQRSLVLAQAIGDQQNMINNLNMLGVLSLYLSAQDEARAHFERSSELARSVGYQRGLAVGHGNLGMLAHMQEDYGAAAEHYEQAFVLAQTIGDQRQMAICLLNLGAAALGQRAYADGQIYLKRSLALGQNIGDQRVMANSLLNLGVSAVAQKSYVDGEAYLHWCHALAQALDDQQVVSRALTYLGLAVFGQGKYVQAHQYYRQSLVVASAIGTQLEKLLAICGFAQINQTTGNLVWAAELAGLASEHPAKESNAQQMLHELLPLLEADLDAATLAAALQRGAASDLEAVVPTLLAEAAPDDLAAAGAAVAVDVALALARARLNAGEFDAARGPLLVSLAGNAVLDEAAELAEGLAAAAHLKLAEGAAEDSAQLAGLATALLPADSDTETEWIAPLRVALEAALDANTLQAAFEMGATLDLGASVNWVVKDLGAARDQDANPAQWEE
ncbi:MAG: tetratricopeptide repeat protein [Chloroflexi bacterium]|nr:tetratricopeptide repeat protein [Chloroflexota bacterium]